MTTTRVGGFLTRRYPREPAGYLTGTVKIAGAPDTPVSRRVHLFTHETSSLFLGVRAIAWTWSTPAGDYRFDGLTTGPRYGVIAYDHVGAFDPAIKFNLVPSEP